MMLHQDGSRHAWLEKEPQLDLIVTLDDATSEILSMFLVREEGKAEEALQRLREIMGKLKLTVNEEKTRICKAPEGEFDFLGYSFGRMYAA
jgi:molybdopterin-biosynthesis enzyme MoeA-like protein